MKELLLTLALVAVATFADAQGTIQFANGAGTRFTINGVIPANYSSNGPVGGTYYFGVFVGSTADSLSSQPVLPMGTNTSVGGLIGAPNAVFSYQIPGYQPITTVFIQIRGWESRFGIDWQRAQAEGLFGQTAIRSVRLGPESGPGTVIWSSTDLTKFQAIDLVPEPSTVALVGLGLGSLSLFRRRK